MVGEIDFDNYDFDGLISRIHEIENESSSASEAARKFSKEFAGNEAWIGKWAADTSGSVRALDDLKKAYTDARQPLIDFNTQIKNSTLSAKAGQIAIKGLALAGSMIASWGISFVISGAVKVIDNFIHRVDRANDAMRDAASEYDNAKSHLESINTELETQSNRMDELLKKDKLTYVEQGELEELKLITEELLIQQDIAEREAARASKESADSAVDAYEEQYGKDPINKESVENLFSSNTFIPITGDDDDISRNIAVLVRYEELLEESKKQLNEALKSGEDTKYLEDTVQNHIDNIKELRGDLDSNLADLQEKKNNIEAEYQRILADKASGEVLSTSEKNIVFAYESISEAIKTIYTYTRPETWNDMQISSIFNTDGIEKTKDELIEMVKSGGELSPEDLLQFPKLNKALAESEILFKNGETAAQAFCDEINAAATASSNLGDAIISSTITSTIQQISTQLQPQFSKLREAYQEIFTLNESGNKIKFSLDNVDNEMLEGIRSTFAEIGDEIGVDFDSSSLESFFEVLSNGNSTAEQVQQAFNNLATSYLYSTDVLDNLNEKTADSIEKQLEEMGITNAQEVVTAALTLRNEELAISKETIANSGKKLSDATIQEQIEFVAAAVASGGYSAALGVLYLKKILADSVNIKTVEDVENVLTLAKAAGVSASALDELSRVMQIFEEAKKSGDPGGLDYARQQLREVSASINAELENFSPVDVEWGPDAKESAGRAGKEAADEYVEAFEKDLKKLDSLKERGKITEKQYLDALRALYEKYFRDREKYLDKYREYEYKYLQGMKSLYESAMSGIIGIYDDHISALNEEKDAAINSLEAQRDAAIDALEAKKEQLEVEKELIQERIDGIDKEIEAKQDQIDAINDEADAKKKAYDLDKAQYELDRLKNQRTIYEYSGKDKGFIYKADDRAIRDQQMEVEDIERENRIDKIEKEIDLLEKQKEIFQSQQDELDKQQASIDKRIDAMNDYYDNLIANTESYWDNMIKGFEETKSRWEELQELQEKAELDTLLRSVTGKGIDEVLSMTNEDFEAFKNTYLSNVAQINAGNQQMLDSLSQISGVDLSTLPGYLAETAGYIDMLSTGIDFSTMGDSLGGVIDSFGELANSAGLATGAIIGGGFSSSTSASAGEKGKESNSSGVQGTGEDLNSAVDTLKTEAIPKIEETASAFDGGEDGDTKSFKGAVDSARDAVGTGENGGSQKKSGSGDESNLQDTLARQTEDAINPEIGIPAQTTKWLELDNVLKGVLKKLEKIEEKILNIGKADLTNLGVSAVSPFATGTDPSFKIGNTYAKGVDGLKRDEKNALRSEYGQPELTVYPDGQAELTTSPIMSDLPKGTVIYNEKQTLDILNGKSSATAIATPVTISPAFQDMALEFRKAVQSNPDALLSGINTQMENISKELQPVRVEQKNMTASYVTTIGDIHLHEVQNVDTLGRAIVTRLPTTVKQIMSIEKK